MAGDFGAAFFHFLNRDIMPGKKNNNVDERFPSSTVGYMEAKEWLKEIGEWDRISTTGFSTDGWSIVNSANSIWKKRERLRDMSITLLQTLCNIGECEFEDQELAVDIIEETLKNV